MKRSCYQLGKPTILMTGGGGITQTLEKCYTKKNAKKTKRVFRSCPPDHDPPVVVVT